MAFEDDDIADDSVARLGVSIEVFIRDGACYAVRQDGKEVRAIVVDYDVEFPCVANNIRRDEDGELYMEQIV